MIAEIERLTQAKSKAEANVDELKDKLRQDLLDSYREVNKTSISAYSTQKDEKKAQRLI